MTVFALPQLDPTPVRPAFARGPRRLDAVRLLRLSITDRCNFRCVYCMPDEGVAFSDRDDLLSADDIIAVAEAAVGVGITHLKVTGGEPTVRGDLLEIIAGLKGVGGGAGPKDLSMTTNGTRLPSLAYDLKRAGLDRLTVSWDTMKPDRFARIARGGGRDGERAMRDISDGLLAAADAGFKHLKVNTVVIAGQNDDEVVDFARLTLEHDWTVRFIEYMPLGESTLVDAAADPVDSATLIARLGCVFGELERIDRGGEAGVGPAEVYRLPGARGRVGFISAMSQPFCETCNRLRLTATGELRSCLFDGGEVPIWPALRPAPDPKRIVDLLTECVAMKPEVHSDRGNRAMSQLGG